MDLARSIVGPNFRVNWRDHPGSSLACPQLPPDHLRPGSLAPTIGDHGPSDSALAAARAWRLRRPGADRHAARCASRDLCSGARPSAPCALEWRGMTIRVCCLSVGLSPVVLVDRRIRS